MPPRATTGRAAPAARTTTAETTAENTAETTAERGMHSRRGAERSWTVTKWIAAAVAFAAVAAVAGCAHDGRTLRRPTADQTTTTRPPSSDTIATTTPAPALQLTSPAFSEGGTIPAAHTCRGGDRSPALAWTGVPDHTTELVVVVRDADADGAVLWLVAGLPPDLGGLAEGTVPAGAVQAANDFGSTGWTGPCPDTGAHHYEFTLYALGERSRVVAGEPGRRAAERVERAPALAVAALSATAPGPAG